MDVVDLDLGERVVYFQERLSLMSEGNTCCEYQGAAYVETSYQEQDSLLSQWQVHQFCVIHKWNGDVLR